MTHIGDRNIRDAQAAESYIQSIIGQYAANPLALSCVVKKDTNEPIGMCGILKRDFISHPDIGYALVPEAYGNGYASEMVAATIEKFFDSTDQPKLYALIKKGNKASIRLIRKLGFTEDQEASSPHENDIIFSLINNTL